MKLECELFMIVLYLSLPLIFMVSVMYVITKPFTGLHNKLKELKEGLS